MVSYCFLFGYPVVCYLWSVAVSCFLFVVVFLWLLLVFLSVIIVFFGLLYFKNSALKMCNFFTIFSISENWVTQMYMSILWCNMPVL